MTRTPTLKNYEPLSEDELDFYAKLSEWTLHDAVILSLGYSPEKITDNSITSYNIKYNNPEFYKEFERRLKIVIAANPILMDCFGRKTPAPSVANCKFVLWAKRIELSLPEELEKRVLRLHNVPHFEGLYNQKCKEIEELKTQLEESRALNQQLKREKSGPQQKLNTAQYYFAGLVDAKFPNNESRIPNVVSALERQEIKCSKNTVTRHYNEGKSLRSNKKIDFDTDDWES